MDAIIADRRPAGLGEDLIQRTETEFAEDFAGHAEMAPDRAAAYLVGPDAEGERERWQKAIRNPDGKARNPMSIL